MLSAQTLTGPVRLSPHGPAFNGCRHAKHTDKQQPRRTIVRADGLQNMINSFSEVVTNSPVNNLKKGIAKVQAGDYDKAGIQGKIDSYLRDNAVVVFSWTRCPFCKNAKALLDDTGAKYLAVELDTMDDGNAIRAQLSEMTNRTSMPNIFIQSKSYGGCNDGPGVVTLQSQGKLDTLLKQAGAL